MPLILHILWLLLLTAFAAFEQVRFRARSRPSTIEIPPNQVLFGLLSTVGLPSMLATILFYPSWSMGYVLSPEMLLPVGWSIVLGGSMTAAAALLLWTQYRWCIYFGQRSRALAHLLSAIWLIGSAMLIALYPDRIMLVGSYSDYWSQRATPLFEERWFVIQSTLAFIATLISLNIWKRLKIQAAG